MIRIIHSRRMNVLWRFWLPTLPVVVAISSISGCAGTTKLETASLQHQISAEDAFVMPAPGGPSIVSVLQKGFANGVEQTVFLATEARVPGQNRFRVRIAGSQDNSRDTTTSLDTMRIAMSNPYGDGRAAIPGVALRRSPYFVKNRYGPFGYMMGRSGSDLCMYAWQEIRAAPALVGKRGLVDVRLRLCRTGATEPQLLSVMYGYTINGYLPQAVWDPYGEPDSPPPTLAKPGEEVFPEADTGYQPSARAKITRQSPESSRSRPAVAAPGAPKVAAHGPLVPPPPEGEPAPSVPAPPKSPE
jgi:hypothetical protein